MTRKPIRIIRIGIMSAALVMIAVGIRQGETALVLEKAVRICLECIGIG